ncbi:MAG TPA: DNA repair protein RadC [Longimicrobiales bacterium]|nr:DNA repair protein RadC [Longimicrobiales bacterium]
MTLPELSDDPSASAGALPAASSPPPIHAWSPEDRPRERLRTVGARHLSVRELLAILVGSGGAGGSAFHVADRLLGWAGGSVRRLGTADPGSLEGVAGVGAATAARVLAALELGRRGAAWAEGDDEPIRGPADVFRRMGSRLRDLPQEEFHALLLNTRHRVIREVAVTRGILDASLIHPREVFRAAVVEGAAGVILVHNHPSGDPTPSPEDRAVTRQLAEAGRALGIPVLDHVVIGDGGWRSVGAEGG